LRAGLSRVGHGARTQQATRIDDWAQSVQLPRDYRVAGTAGRGVVVNTPADRGYVTIRFIGTNTTPETDCSKVDDFVTTGLRGVQIRQGNVVYARIRPSSDARRRGTSCECDLAVDVAGVPGVTATTGLFIGRRNQIAACLDVPAEDCIAILDAVAARAPASLTSHLGRAAD
jgi:hypothetical protein